MPEFFIIIARKIFFPNFRGGHVSPLPSVCYAYAIAISITSALPSALSRYFDSSCEIRLHNITAVLVQSALSSPFASLPFCRCCKVSSFVYYLRVLSVFYILHSEVYVQTACIVVVKLCDYFSPCKQCPLCASRKYSINLSIY